MTENAAAKMERVDFRGMDVWYRRAGAGKPLLFLHNGGNSHIIWQRQLQHFAASHECFAFDLPGYGKSVNLSMRYSLQFYVDFLREFMTQMGIEKVTLVGNCVGSAISLSHAIEQPESVERLILFNILTKATVWDGILGPFFKLTAPVPFMRPLLKSTFGGIRSPAVVSRYSVAKQYGNKSVRDPRLDAELCALYRQKGQVGALADILVDINSFDRLDRFRMPEGFPPTIVLWGEDNHVLPCPAGRRLVGMLRPRRFEVIAGAGHLVMHESAEAVNTLIDVFLAEEPAP